MIPVTTTSIVYWTLTGRYLLSLLVLYVETVAVPEMLLTQNVSFNHFNKCCKIQASLCKVSLSSVTSSCEWYSVMNIFPVVLHTKQFSLCSKFFLQITVYVQYLRKVCMMEKMFSTVFFNAVHQWYHMKQQYTK